MPESIINKRGTQITGDENLRIIGVLEQTLELLIMNIFSN